MGRPLYENPAVRAVTGETLRPGGFVLTDRAVEVCMLRPGARAADIGCGSGATVRRLRRRHGLAAVGCDLSTTLLEKASPDAAVIQACAEALPMAGGSMAAVFMECVLSLVAFPADVVTECFRILAPRGHVILSDLYQRESVENGLFSGGKTRDNGGMTAKNKLSCASGALSRRALERLFQENGFEVLLWEDHTRLLGELAARIVFAHGSLDRFWASAGAACRPGNCRGRPGYCLMICQKRSVEKVVDERRHV